jgi:hypothetical protein
MTLFPYTTLFRSSDTPEAILQGHGDCVVARAVIGPKRAPEAPYLLRDWTATAVWREGVEAEDFEGFLEAAARVRRRVFEAHPRLATSFMVRIGRTLDPHLRLNVEAIFHE